MADKIAKLQKELTDVQREITSIVARMKLMEMQDWSETLAKRRAKLNLRKWKVLEPKEKKLIKKIENEQRLIANVEKARRNKR